MGEEERAKATIREAFGRALGTNDNRPVAQTTTLTGTQARMQMLQNLPPANFNRGPCNESAISPVIRALPQTTNAQGSKQ